MSEIDETEVTMNGAEDEPLTVTRIPDDRGVAQTKSMEGLTVAASAESMASMLEAQARAMVASRWTLALERPRNMAQVRQRMLDECRQFGFASKARYSVPRGWKKDPETGRDVVDPVTKKKVRNYIEGPSIRFAEAMLQAMGHLMVEVNTIFEDKHKRLVQVVVTDVQTGATVVRPVTVPFTVERRYLPKGMKSIATRVNSYGDAVHIVPATADEIRQTEGALVSKAVRTELLRLIPYSLKEAAERQCVETVAAGAKDPEIVRRMLDRFAQVRVTREQIAEYLGHALDKVSPDEVRELAGIFTAIEEGSTTWAKVMANDDDGGEDQTESKTRVEVAAKGPVPEEPRRPAEQRVIELAEKLGLTIVDLRKIGEDVGAPRFQRLADLTIDGLGALEMRLAALARDAAKAKPEAKPARGKKGADPAKLSEEAAATWAKINVELADRDYGKDTLRDIAREQGFEEWNGDPATLTEAQLATLLEAVQREPGPSAEGSVS